MKSLLLAGCAFFVWSCQQPFYQQTAPPFDPDYALNRFENTIRLYEKQDSLELPEASGIVFAGSSSFFFWKNIKQDLAPLNVINRGFGGSTLPEVLYYANRSIVKYKPNAVVIYCENDLYSTKPKTPDQMRDAYVGLVKLLRARLPKVELYFVSLKPSPLRWKQWHEATEANRLIGAFIKTQKHHHYVDITSVMLKNGRPDGRIFLADSLHMNSEGYRRWTEVLKPILIKNSI